jgi:hypothetical protein
MREEIKQNFVPNFFRFLSHGRSYRTISTEFHLHFSTIFQIVNDVCIALWNALQPIFLSKPDQPKWLEIADGFNEKWQFPLTIGALDGKHFACIVCFLIKLKLVH